MASTVQTRSQTKLHRNCHICFTAEKLEYVGDQTSNHHDQTFRGENMVINVFTNVVFFLAGIVTVAMHYSLNNPQLVVLVLITHSTGRGGAKVGTSMTLKIQRNVQGDLGNLTILRQGNLHALHKPMNGITIANSDPKYVYKGGNKRKYSTLPSLLWPRQCRLSHYTGRMIWISKDPYTKHHL